jgi:hypothetical protein
MVPPKVGTLDQNARKTCNSTRSPHDTTIYGVNIYSERVVDVDVIPSLVIELVSPTLVEEKHVLTIEEMEIDTQGEIRNPCMEQNLMQQIGIGITQLQVETNKEDDERTKSYETQQLVVDPTHHSKDVLVKYITRQQDSNVEEDEEENHEEMVGPSTTQNRNREKLVALRTPTK